MPGAEAHDPLLGQLKGKGMYINTLHDAARKGLCGIIETHLLFGVPIDLVNEEGYTALHLAAIAGHTDACSLLLSRGANKSRKTIDGKTALKLAREKGNVQVTALLGASSSTTSSLSRV